MDEFIKSFEVYWKEAPYNTFLFWAIIFGTIVIIWALTTVGLKIFRKPGKLKTSFIVNKACIISSLIVAAVLISGICYCWANNIFSQQSYQLPLLIALIIALVIPIIAFANLRKYYSSENLKEIIDQPKTIQQSEKAIPLVKKAFTAIKWYYILPLLGFLSLLIYLNKGTNLITIVFDNSGSMETKNAQDALSETFNSLEENNEIILTTLDGYTSQNDPAGKQNMTDLMQVSQSSKLKGGKINAFNTPIEAQSNLSSVFISGQTVWGSPICESMWKTWLFVKETKSNQTFKKRLLIVITDGVDNIDPTLASGKFFFDNSEFSDYFAPEKSFIIDYSGGTPTNFMRRCEDSGCDIYPAENNKDDYLNGLDNALQSFKNNWYLIYWVICIFSIFTIIGLIIPPKKIV